MWRIFIHFLWASRNFLSLGNVPIEVRVGHELIYMVPEGHIAELMWSGGFEKEERNYVENYLKPGMRVLNIGANSGLYTLIAAKIVGQKGEVHAFEPATMNCDRLRRNVALNKLNNVFINQSAASDFTGTLAVRRDLAHPTLDSHFFVQRIEDEKPLADTVELISCDTIDNYWRSASNGEFKKLDMIIIDVEGAELSVFEGMRTLFAASPNLVMIMECTENISETKQYFSDFNFSFYRWDLNMRQLLPAELKRGSFIARRETSKN